MGNFFNDPFGGSFIGRVYTKLVTGNKDYSVFNPKNNNGAWGRKKKDIGQSLSSNDENMSEGMKAAMVTADKSKCFYEETSKEESYDDFERSYHKEKHLNELKTKNYDDVRQDYKKLSKEKASSETIWGKIKGYNDVGARWFSSDSGRLDAATERLAYYNNASSIITK